MRNTIRFVVAASIFIPALSGQIARASIIDTAGGWNGADRIYYFGEVDTATYGQTITAGPDNILTNFSFTLRQDSTSPVKFRAYVMAWNDGSSRATGVPLFTSGDMSTTTQDVYQTFTVNTGALALTSGSQYVLFFNTSNNFDTITDSASWASRATGDTYPGGLFVYLNNGDTFANVTTQAWERNHQGPGYDLAFRAEFVPEPTSLLLGGLAALGLTAVAGRRRRLR